MRGSIITLAFFLVAPSALAALLELGPRPLAAVLPAPAAPTIVRIAAAAAAAGVAAGSGAPKQWSWMVIRGWVLLLVVTKPKSWLVSTR